MKRMAHPSLSPVGQKALTSFERWLREREGLALEEYLPTLPADTVYLFPSSKTREILSERALGYIE